MGSRRVVITGLGMVSPLGNTVDSSWKSLIAGESGISKIESFDCEGFATQISGQIKDFDVTQYDLTTKDARKIDVFIQYGLAAAYEAMKDAKLDDNAESKAIDENRIGVAVGSGIGGISTIEQTVLDLDKKGPRRVSPFFIPASIVNMAAGNIAIKYGLKGPNFAIATACTTGTHNIGYGARTIAYGDADIMVVGGAEMATCPAGVAGFAAARAMTTRNDDPTKASRPWDKDRDGFVLGDGAGILVLEEYEHAKKRGATIYAELAGFGMSDDAHHITSPPEDGSGARAAMQNALNDAGMTATDVQYINAHGTSTHAGDIAETAAIRSIYGEHADKVAVSSSKSMTGHLLGAAGAIEAIFTIKAITDSIAPPTINLDEAGEGCDLDYVPNTAREMNIDAAISNSFGFGGTNGSLLFKKL
ncbi:MAG TPA: beta-ketoacyl-[acyl-carrier-protein] synthase II [Oceanospirillales bacterium]|nr:beta-ketoacyl-[acyl-carrier-protein] synthase II [Oceanospirillales bacterium]|tara:strand:- start:1072 stop:2325 length:1254 start_codon:yes stop_codon:yes gene_type:complete